MSLNIKDSKSIKSKFLCLLACLSIFLPKPQVNAFGTYAHSLIWEIAYRQLTPATREYLDDFINPHLELLSRQTGINYDQAHILGSFSDDDELRSFAPTYHYSTRRVYNPDGIDLSEYRSQDDIETVLPDLMQFFTGNRGDSDFNTAIRFTSIGLMVHYMSDAHQPFHSVQPFFRYLVTEDNELGNSRGGNRVFVRFDLNGERERRSLHAFSDGVNVFFNGRVPDPENPDQFLEVPPIRCFGAGDNCFLDVATEFARNQASFYADFLFDKYADEIQSGEISGDEVRPRVWLDESEALAIAFLDKISDRIAELQSPGSSVLLTEQEVNDITDVLERRMLLAGFRLAAIFEDYVASVIAEQNR